MDKIRQRKFLFALLALVLVFAGCKGESPTAPPPSSGGGTPGGGVTPPTGSVITLTVSNATPLIDSTSVITATVTKDNQPVPNGTAVEFQTSPLGTFTDTGTNVSLRTTTNGVATATVTSSTAGTTTITAVVTNVTKTTTIEFKAKPVIQPPIDTTPTITSISPNFGRPQGGETVRITGTNFRVPLRVLFDFGAGTTPKEAFPVGSSATTIDVLTPPVDIGAGQQKTATIIVIVDAGTTNELRATSRTPFTYQLEQLTPKVTTVSPSSGPINGGTRITIFGEGFETAGTQQGVRVYFGAIDGNSWQDVQVTTVTFNQIIAITPPGSSTTPGGSGSVTGPVDLRIVNISSAKEVTLDNAFRYTPSIVINAIAPLTGSSLGGTDITIDGNGFDDPVQVSVAGILAQPLRVSGTQLLVRTNPTGNPCTGSSGPVIVTNIEDGARATSSSTFTYQAVVPRIVSITQDPVPGGTSNVVVRNPGVGPLGTAEISFSLDNRVVFVSPSTITTGTGDQSFSITVPLNITLPTVACMVGPISGTQLGPTDVDVVFNNLTTGCTARVQDGLHILPPATNPCVLPPPPIATQVAPVPPNCADAGSVTAAGSATGTATITFRNDAAAGSQPLIMTHGAPTGPNAAEFSVSPASATIQPGQVGSFTVTFDPSSVAAGKSATITFSTNDPAQPTISVCLQGNGT